MRSWKRTCAPLAMAMMLASAPVVAGETAKPRDPAFEEAVRSYLLDNPEVIIEALERYEILQRQQREKAAAGAIAKHAEDLFNNPMTPVSGNPEGDVTLVEFFDYQCGYCKQVLPSVMKLIESDPQLRIVWKELPILGANSEFAARAAMAADRQGKYFDVHVKLMETRGRLTTEQVLKIASQTGLDVERLKKDMLDPAITEYLKETLRLAQNLGITGTPGFVIGDRVVPGAVDKGQLKELIAAVRDGR